MKTNLFFTVAVAALLTLNTFAQDYELWGLAPTGTGNTGYVYKMDGKGDNKVIVYGLTQIEGKNPKGGLVQALNKKLYGMTNLGGANDLGVLFEYDVSKQKYSVMYEFDGANGKFPNGDVIQASNGKLYGMTRQGGDNDKGVIFEFDLSTSTYKKLLDLHDTLGNYPEGSLFQADVTDSILFYGLTSEGGANDGGVFFTYSLTDSTYRIIKSFDGFYPYHKEFGRHPYGSVMQADNGKIYGLTFHGGTSDNGVLFEYDPDSLIFRKKLDFGGAGQGKRPKASLIQAADGKLYGTTVYGPGDGGVGSAFSFDIETNTLNTLYEFNDAMGKYPQGSLLQASNGKMYGTTYLGACSSGGVFEFDLVTGDSRRTACNGYPTGNLIEIEAICLETSDSIAETACGSYTSPSGKYTWTTSGVYMDTIPNVCGGDSIIKINLTVKTVDVSVTQDGIHLSADLAGASYQWLDCDNGYASLSGDTNQVFTATANGNYAVAVTQDNCTDTSACYSVTTVGIQGNSFGQEVKLYPNPASGEVTIEYGDLTGLNISVFNITGKIVYSVKNTIEMKTVIPAGSLQPGVYFVRIKSNKQQKMIKLVKQ